MSPLDQESIESKIIRIRKNLAELKKLAKLPFRKYIGDFRSTSLAERLIHVTIEAMLDIGSHIVAEEAWGEPLEYRDIFKLLIKGRVLPAEKEKKFVELAGLRNRIVHLYEDIDHKLLHRALKSELNDFELFIKAVLRYLNLKKKKS